VDPTSQRLLQPPLVCTLHTSDMHIHCQAGAYANHFFLKLLATTGRGNFDVAFRSHSIQAQIKRMLVGRGQHAVTVVLARETTV
jgi:hypothetical protein